MRFCLLLVLLCAGTAQAQRGLYFGFGVSYATFSGLSPNNPQPSLQVGGPVSGTELRGTLESLLLACNLGVDVLYTLTEETTDYRIYAGGPNTRLYLYFPNGFDLRAVVGGEYFFAREDGSAPLGVFGEVQTQSKRSSDGVPHRRGPRRNQPAPLNSATREDASFTFISRHHLLTPDRLVGSHGS